jgi:parallel beta-helix repeat protein
MGLLVARQVAPARRPTVLLVVAGLVLVAALGPWSAGAAFADSEIQVNTASDNNDSDGNLTLREAICVATTGNLWTNPDCTGSIRAPTGGELVQASGIPGPGESDRIVFSNSFTIDVDCANLGPLPPLTDNNGGIGGADTIDGSGHTIKIRPGDGCADKVGLQTAETSTDNVIRGIQVLQRGSNAFKVGVELQGAGNHLEAGSKDTACRVQGGTELNSLDDAVAVVSPATNTVVDGCEIDHSAIGVFVAGAVATAVTNNHIHDNSLGALLEGNTGGGLAGNTIENNTLGGVVSAISDPADRILIGSNIIRNNGGSGVKSFESLDIIENNSFSENKGLAIDLVSSIASDAPDRVSCGGGEGDEPLKIAGQPGVHCPKISSANLATKTITGTVDTKTCPSSEDCLVEVYLAFDDGDNTGENTSKPHGEGFQPLGFTPVDADGNWSLTLPNPFAKGDAFTALAFNPARGLTSEFGANLVVPGSNLTVTPASAKATVSFSPPASSEECPIQSYLVNVYLNGKLVKTVKGSGSPILVDGLQNGQSYSFSLVAVYCSGNGPESARSGPVAIGQSVAVPDGVFLSKAGAPLSFGGDNVYDTGGGGGGGSNVGSGDGPKIVGSASIPFRIQNDGSRADRIKVRSIESSRSLAGITITVDGLKVNDGTTPELAANGGKLDGNIVVKVASNAAKGNYVVRITLQANGSSDPAQSDSVTLRFKV